MRYAINVKTGRPELVDIGLSCFPHDIKSIKGKPSQSKNIPNKDDTNGEVEYDWPASYKNCMLSLLLKLDKQVRLFNGLNMNQKYSRSIFH